jgi:cell division protein FtsZ
MDSLVADALTYAAKQQTPETASKNLKPAGVKISVVGCGGAGTNTVSRLTQMGVTSAETIAINTDANHLKMVEANRKLLIGASLTKGLGAGGFPEVGRKCAEQARGKIGEMLSGSELVFITAGMGGGTGTGTAPVVAQVAKEQGAIAVGVVTFPFALERARLDKADWGLEALAETCDTVVIIDNNRLVQYVPNLPMNQAFAVADTLVAKAVKGISDTIMLPSLVNIDFADVRSILGNAGMAMISVGEASGRDRIAGVVKNTLEHPLLDVEYSGSKGALIHIQGGSQLSLGEVTQIGEGITEAFDQRANVIWGARVNPDMGEKVVVTSIITGVHSPQVIGKSMVQPKAEKAYKLGIAEINY